MENKRITKIFENICKELGKGSSQYYSTVVKTHYLQLTGVRIPTVFLIHSDEIGPDASKVPMYIIRAKPKGEPPTEELITISYEDIEIYISLLSSIMVNLKNIVKEISDVFGDPLYVANDYPDQITLVYSSMVLFELKRESSDIIEYTIIYLGTGEYKMKKIKTTTEKVILDSILNSVAEGL